jgi:hypothetical protein
MTLKLYITVMVILVAAAQATDVRLAVTFFPINV